MGAKALLHFFYKNGKYGKNAGGNELIQMQHFCDHVDTIRHPNSSYVTTDTPQFRGGNPYFFSENPYQSVSFIYVSMYRENVHAIHITVHIAMEFGKNLDIV